MNKPPTVVLVDDEPAVLKALSRLLKMEGYAVLGFNSGREFMDKYEGGVGDCAVLDISMPGTTGLDVQQWLASSAIPLPIIFLTGQDDPQVRAQALTHGAVDILIKPVLLRTLLQCLQRAFALNGGLSSKSQHTHTSETV